MNIYSWVVAISMLLLLMMESLQLHEATVCRQEAWRGSVVLLTNELMTVAKPQDTLFSPRCKFLVQRNKKSSSWRRFSPSAHVVELSLKGKL